MSIESDSVAILGCGAMGTALLEGWLKTSPNLRFHLHVQSANSLVRLNKRLGILSGDCVSRIQTTQAGNHGLVAAAKNANMIILACPPGELATVIGEPGFLQAVQNKTLVSVLAGVSFQMIREAIRSVAASDAPMVRLARVIPSLGASMGESVTMIAEDDKSTAQDTRVDALFSSVGTTIHLPEKYMNKATALGAVCHALAIIATDTAADSSAGEGLPRPLAKDLAAKCFKSCGSMMDQGSTPEQLKDAMAVPQGITINAVLNLEKAARSNIAGAVRDAIQYADRMA